MNREFWKEKRVLIIEDEKELTELIRKRFVSEGYFHVHTAHSLREAFEKLDAYKPDIILLDIMLGDGSGYEILRHIQKRPDFKIPVLFLTTKDQKEDILKGFREGADDYIVKPFSMDELLLRTEAVLKRVYRKSDSILLEDCLVDFEKACIVKDGQEIPLTAKEFALLRKLAANANRIVTTDALMEAIWGEETFGYENSLNMHIRRVREKIENNPSQPVSLMTIKGIGYKLMEKSNEK